jgi:hypothetical protein
MVLCATQSTQLHNRAARVRIHLVCPAQKTIREPIGDPWLSEYGV